MKHHHSHNTHHSHETSQVTLTATKQWLILGLTVLLIGMGWWGYTTVVNSAPGKFDTFAKCLAEKKITMYGANWCKHCQNEKRAFGASFKYVPYVECPDNPQLCIEKGVQGYPTWIFPDGKILSGEQGIQKLSQESSCPLPTE